MGDLRFRVLSIDTTVVSDFIYSEDVPKVSQIKDVLSGLLFSVNSMNIYIKIVIWENTCCAREEKSLDVLQVNLVLTDKLD